MRRRRGSCGQGFEPRLLPVERRRAESSGPPAELPVVAVAAADSTAGTTRTTRSSLNGGFAMCLRFDRCRFSLRP